MSMRSHYFPKPVSLTELILYRFVDATQNVVATKWTKPNAINQFRMFGKLEFTSKHNSESIRVRLSAFCRQTDNGFGSDINTHKQNYSVKIGIDDFRVNFLESVA